MPKQLRSRTNLLEACTQEIITLGYTVFGIQLGHCFSGPTAQLTYDKYGNSTNCNKISGRSVSVYTDTSASHEYWCTLIQNGHEFCKLNDFKQQCFQIAFKINVKNLENCEKSCIKSVLFCISEYSTD